MKIFAFRLSAPSFVRWLFTCAMILNAIVSSAQDAAPRYWSDRWRGWHFYEDPAPEEPPRPVLLNKDASARPARAPELLEFERLQKTLEDTRNIAIMRPTEANVRRYMELEAQVVARASTFADVAQRVAWATPELDPTLQGRPVNAKALEVFEQTELVDRSRSIAELGKDHVLFFFYRSDCPYCHAFAPTLAAFQARHGLAADGVIGRETVAQLEVSPAHRMRQIVLGLERLRWTPRLRAPRSIVVNVPEFMLRAYTLERGAATLALQMRVIVGKALDTRTPLFAEDMRFIEFSPYWNVPPSIAQAELVPKLRRSPGYFASQGFEFVDGEGRAHTALTPESLDAVLRGRMRIRQRPGPANALGDIKFVFPNNNHIYLHHTPAPLLFQRDRRDFSHGCIRIEDPVALARFVLHNDPAWPEPRIREAMARGQSATLRLADPLPVVIAYSTAIVKQGKTHFFADLYGQDKLLDRALRQQSEQRRLRARPGL